MTGTGDRSFRLPVSKVDLRDDAEVFLFTFRSLLQDLQHHGVGSLQKWSKTSKSCFS